MRKVLDNIQIVVNGCEDMQDKEIRAYINKVRPEKGVVLKKLIITLLNITDTSFHSKNSTDNKIYYHSHCYQ